MFSRINSFRFVAVLVAAFLMVTGLQSGATAAVTRTLSISASPAVGVVGTAVTFSGRLSRSPRGTLIVIQRKAGTKWVKAGATRTVNAAGNYAVKLARPKSVGTYYFRATSAAKGNLRKATSRSVAVAALRRTLVSLSSSTAQTTAGSTVTLSGTVLPFVKGTLVTLQRKVGSSWTNVTTTTVLANGTFAKGVVPSTTTTYRASVSRTTLNAPGLSNERVVKAKPLITTTSLPAATRLGSYSTTLATYGNQVGTWSIPASGPGSLPAGLTLTNPAKGIISGSPTAVGDTQVVVGFTQLTTGLAAATKTLTLRVNQAVAPTITTSTLPSGTRLASGYTAQLTAAGNPAGTWSAAPLPDGLELNASTGVIFGTPTTVETKQVVIGFTQTNTGLAAPSKTIALQINQAVAPVITTTSLPDGSVADEYTTTLTAQGNPAGTWTASPLPDGLELNITTGVISGTPEIGSNGDTQVQIGFTQTSTGLAAASKTLTLRIDPGDNPVISTASLPNGTRLTPGYSTTLTATGNPAGTWTASPLPAGLTLDADTGVISGTPTTIGDTQVVIGFTQNSTGLSATPKTLNLHINQAAAPVISTANLPDGNRLASYTTTLTATGSPAGTWTASPLPAGLTLDEDTGVISGTPTAVGDTQVVIGFIQNSTGVPATPKTLNLRINEAVPPVISTTALPNALRYHAYTTGQLAVAGNPVGTWSATGVPTGMSFDTSTGILSGAPRNAGDFNITFGFTQTNTGLAATPKALVLHVTQSAPVITTAATLPEGSRFSYTTQLAVAPAPVGTWSLVSGGGSPPLGITLKSSGQLSGATLFPGTWTFTARFTETSTGLSSQKAFTLTLH